jgi:hypothetical protein
MADEVEVSAAAVEQTSTTVGVEGELKSMGGIARALDSVSADNAALGRVLTWVNQRYGGAAQTRVATVGEQAKPTGSGNSAPQAVDENKLKSDSVADLFAAANPTTEADKALVVASWLQTQNEEDWTGFMVHSQLKHLGHGVSNITVAIETLISQKPQLAMQTRKSGKSKQARKLYRLTTEGLKMLSSNTEEDQSV